MTCIYDAWSEALRIGHDQIQLKKEPILQQTMFDEYVHVDGDNVKAEKVIRSVRRDISDEAYLDVYMQPFLRRKMRYRQFIISCVSDLQWEVRYWNSIRILM